MERSEDMNWQTQCWTPAENWTVDLRRIAGCGCMRMAEERFGHLWRNRNMEEAYGQQHWTNVD